MKKLCNILLLKCLSYKIDIGGFMEKAIHFLMDEIGLEENAVVVAGISGGPDSMALLHLLQRIRKKKNIKISQRLFWC